MFNRRDISKGMIVKSLDGERLGRVISVNDTSFEIEKGLFFVKDYRVRYSDVRGFEGDDVILAIGKAGLTESKELGAETYGTAKAATLTGAGAAAAGPIERIKEKVKERRAAEGWNEEIRIPLHHEELAWSKTDKASGEVHIHKSVIEEEKTVSVPLRHERVSVERRPLSKDRPLMATKAFEEEDVVMPLHEETAELTKRQVADEEVVIHKEPVEEQRSYSAKVMREEVDIDGKETKTRRS